ncbi:hypothetical protein CKO15_11480 [Halorhodospira abdelmalekii]|uniref:hypothetical protein n=1 Tax=Halorhodospira abdelmalekii TaxID=421629 RepID=UPI001903D5D4|nr:hypothetical protein [Halorhodospira abdelmalekii]MBK1735886.1 hypothetical protein [Halorhodospira abdelmalekii]
MGIEGGLPRELRIEGTQIHTPQRSYQVDEIAEVRLEEGRQHVTDLGDGIGCLSGCLGVVVLFFLLPLLAFVVTDEPAAAILAFAAMALITLVTFITLRLVPRYRRVLEIHPREGVVDRSIWRRGRHKGSRPDELQEAEQALRRLLR